MAAEINSSDSFSCTHEALHSCIPEHFSVGHITTPFHGSMFPVAGIRYNIDLTRLNIDLLCPDIVRTDIASFSLGRRSIEQTVIDVPTSVHARNTPA